MLELGKTVTNYFESEEIKLFTTGIQALSLMLVVTCLTQYWEGKYANVLTLTLVTSACFLVGETSEGGTLCPPSFLGH